MSRHNTQRGNDDSTEAETMAARVDEIEATQVTMRIHVPNQHQNIIATTDGDTATTAFVDGHLDVIISLQPHHDEYAAGTLTFSGNKDEDDDTILRLYDDNGRRAKTMRNPRTDTMAVHDEEKNDE